MSVSATQRYVKVNNFSVYVLPKCGISYFEKLVRINKDEFSKLNSNIFIYREPSDRLISFYVNKVLALSHFYGTKEVRERERLKLHRIWKKLFKTKNMNVSFREFVKILLKSLDPEKVNDLHLQSQHKNYDRKINYDFINKLEDQDKLESFLSQFSNNIDYNIDPKCKNESMTVETDQNVCDLKIEDFEKLGGVPKNKKLFLDDEIEKNIKVLYSHDYRFLEEIRS